MLHHQAADHSLPKPRSQGAQRAMLEARMNTPPVRDATFHDVPDGQRQTAWRPENTWFWHTRQGGV
jgi:hypothetical protein